MPEDTKAPSLTRSLTFFRGKTETLGQFAAELKKLSPEEKVALAAEVEAFLAAKAQA